MPPMQLNICLVVSFGLVFLSISYPCVTTGQAVDTYYYDQSINIPKESDPVPRIL